MTTSHIYTVLIDDFDVEVTYDFTPGKPASSPDGPGGRMLEAPTNDEIEITGTLSHCPASLWDLPSLYERVEEEYTDHLINHAMDELDHANEAADDITK